MKGTRDIGGILDSETAGILSVAVKVNEKCFCSHPMEKKLC